jgi:hypothetical protein
MPDFTEFCNVFHVYPGLQLGEFTLTQITGTHESVKLWNEYEYAMQLTFRVPKDFQVERLAQKLYSYVSGIREWYSPANRRYFCIFVKPHSTQSIKAIDVQTVVVYLTGFARRVSKHDDPVHYQF